MARNPSSLSDPNRTYRAYGSALKFWTCKSDAVLFEGGAGCGKSRALIERAHLQCMKYEGCRLLFVRKTRESLTESALQIYEDEVLPAGDPLLASAHRRVRQSYRYPNGSVIVTGGMDKASKFMSTQYDGIYCFEATELTTDDYEMLDTRLGRRNVLGYSQFAADCNPGHPNHWLNQKCKKGEIVRIKGKLEDNPMMYDHKDGKWTDQGEKYRKRLARLTGARYKRLFLGQWAASEGMVFPDYDFDLHTVNKFRPTDWKNWRKIISVDFGFNHPFVAQWWAVNSEGVMYRYREIHMSKRLVSDHAKIINKFSDGERIEAVICDWDAEGRATMEAAGIPTIPAYKEKLRGIEAVQLRMRSSKTEKPTLFLMRDSVVETDTRRKEEGRPTSTIEEFDGYVWAKNRDGTVTKEETVKEDDDGMDAMRYAVAYVDGLDGMRISVQMDEPSSVTDINKHRIDNSYSPEKDDPTIDDESEILHDGPCSVFV